MDEALVGMLRGDAALVERIGDRIFPDAAPEATTLPFVTYFEVSDGPGRTLGGRSGANRHEYQVDVHAATRRQSREVGDLVAARLLQCRRGGVWAGILVQAVLPPIQSSRWSEPRAGEERGHPVRMIEVVIWASE